MVVVNVLRSGRIHSQQYLDKDIQSIRVVWNTKKKRANPFKTRVIA
jgi:hypothetical protein